MENMEERNQVIKNLIASAEENARMASEELAMYKNRIEVLKQVLEELEKESKF